MLVLREAWLRGGTLLREEKQWHKWAITHTIYANLKIVANGKVLITSHTIDSMITSMNIFNDTWFIDSKGRPDTCSQHAD